MKRTFLPLLFASCLMGANPELYSGLGDSVYEGMPKVSELSEVKAVGEYRSKMEKFVARCSALKKEGLALDKGVKDKAETQVYLNTLRALNQEYEFYQHVADTALEASVRKNDYPTFAALIGTGLIDIEARSNLILGFYQKHRMIRPIEEVDAYIDYLNEAKALKDQARAKRRAQYEAYKKRRLNQINDRYDAKKEARREAIDEETRQIKEEVKRTQEQELRKTR